MWSIIFHWYSSLCLVIQENIPLLLAFIIILIIVIIKLINQQRILKKSEYMLSILKYKYNNIIENSSDIIWEIDKDLKITFTSSRLRDIQGCYPKDLIGMSYKNILFLSNFSEASYIFNSFIDNRKSFFNIETRFTSYKGADIILLASGFALVDKEGEFCGYICICKDITIQRRDNNALKEVKTRFEQAFRNSPISMAISILNSGFYLDVNKSFEKFTGYKRDEVIGKTSLELGIMTPSVRGDFCSELCTKGFIENEEIAIVRKDGTERIGLFSGVIMYIDEHLALLSTAIDISQKRIIERQFEQKTKEQQILVENTELMIWQLRDPKTYGIVNDACAKFFGIRKEELEGSSFYDILSSKESQEFHKFTKEVFLKLSSTADIWFTNNANEKRLLSICCDPKFDMDGNVQYAVCFAMDITAKKQQECEAFFN